MQGEVEMVRPTAEYSVQPKAIKDSITNYSVRSKVIREVLDERLNRRMRKRVPSNRNITVSVRLTI